MKRYQYIGTAPQLKSYGYAFGVNERAIYAFKTVKDVTVYIVITASTHTADIFIPYEILSRDMFMNNIRIDGLDMNLIQDLQDAKLVKVIEE